jgi:hypothetical protein
LARYYRFATKHCYFIAAWIAIERNGVLFYFEIIAQQPGRGGRRTVLSTAVPRPTDRAEGTTD